MGRRLIVNTALMTAASLLMRCIAMGFQGYLAGRIGAAGIGLYQLVMSVEMLATTFAVSGIRFAVTRLVSEELGFKRHGPRGHLQPAVRQRGNVRAHALCRAHRLPLDRGRAHGALAAHTGHGPALHSALQRAERILHRLRAYMETIAGASDRADSRGSAGGVFPQPGAAGGHRAQLRRRLRRRDLRRRAERAADAGLLRRGPEEVRFPQRGERAPDGEAALHGPSAGRERLCAQRAVHARAPAGAARVQKKRALGGRGARRVRRHPGHGHAGDILPGLPAGLAGRKRDTGPHGGSGSRQV